MNTILPQQQSVSAADFVPVLFDGLGSNETIALVPVKGYGSPATNALLEGVATTQEPLYSLVSSVKPLAEQETDPRYPSGSKPYQTRKIDLERAFCVLLDDVGTKVNPLDILVPPTWKMETSAGNFQWGYRIKPTDDLEHYALCIESLIAARLSDSGAKGAYRKFRIPGSLHKTDFRASLEEWHPDRIWALDDLMQALGVEPMSPGQPAVDLANRERQAMPAPRSYTPGPGQISPIDAYNEAYLLEDLLNAYYHKVGDRWMHPDSQSGAPGIALKDGRCFSHHSRETDPLADGYWHDCFDVFVQHEHNGNFNAALKAAANMLKTPDNISITEHNQRIHTAAKDSEAQPIANWPELADPFAEYPIPHFPMDILPESLRTLAEEKSQQSGFDAGGYAFSLIVAAGNTVDHRSRLDLGPFSVPAFSWGGIVGASGAGKSPIINDSKHAAESIEAELVAKSREAYRLWEDAAAVACANKTPLPRKPVWRQRHALDITVEALGKLLADNPEGVNFYPHEITEFLGRMDAYGGKDGGKDRGTYLRAYDGGSVTINRAGRAAPLVVDQFSVGILAGIQPEVLAQKFRSAGAGADGLYQRFMVYCLQPTSTVDYNAFIGLFTEVNVLLLFKELDSLAKTKPFTVNLSPDARQLMQGFHNTMRNLGKRTPAQRFAEHIDKYPGFLGRIAFTLHLIESAASGSDHLRMVTVETMDNAIRLMRVLYRHSETVYSILDKEAGEVRTLVQSAAEAILAKQWNEFMRGDLTRHATNWRCSDDREAESAIDNLIELGWIADITPAPKPGTRGRRSAGKFKVNPAVHDRFKEKAERIKQERAERYQALQDLKAAR